MIILAITLLFPVLVSSEPQFYLLYDFSMNAKQCKNENGVLYYEHEELTGNSKKATPCVKTVSHLNTTTDPYNVDSNIKGKIGGTAIVIVDLYKCVENKYLLWISNDAQTLEYGLYCENGNMKLGKRINGEITTSILFSNFGKERYAAIGLSFTFGSNMRAYIENGIDSSLINLYEIIEGGSNQFKCN